VAERVPSRPPAFDAVVLAGGRASRLGGIDKPGLMVGARTLLASVVAAADSAGAQRIVVVGPARPELADRAVFVREDPPESGPIPALRRGLAQVSAPAVAVLAADLPFLRARHLRILLGALPAGPSRPVRPASSARHRAHLSGVIMVDDGGHRQWLAGCWRTTVLRTAMRAYSGDSLHGLLEPLDPARLDPARLDPARLDPARLDPARLDPARGEPPPWLDCDTSDDLIRARRLARRYPLGDTRPGDTGPGDIGPGDIGPGDIGPGDIGPGDIGPGDIGPGDIGPGQTQLERETRR
jgi:molybdopterin-guanine dinucleotide biosynthesis protein A